MHKNLKTSRPQARLTQGRGDWYRIVNKAESDTTLVYIYDEIGYWGVDANTFVHDLNEITSKKIELHINTPGGDVFAGIAIYQALKDHDAEITSIVDSLAASAGSFIAMAGATIIMQKNAQMMIHKAMGLCVGNDDDMEQMREMLVRQTENIASIYAERAGGEVSDWVAAMKEETWYNADEAVAAGLADQVGKDDGEDTKNKWDLSIFNYAGREAAPTPQVKPAEVQFDAEEFGKMMREVTA